MSRRNYALAIIAAALANILWGSTLMASKAVLADRLPSLDAFVSIYGGTHDSWSLNEQN
jgi:hypothetical protein